MSGTGQNSLIITLIEDGYAVDERRGVVRVYIRDSHRAFDIHKHAIEHGYLITGFKNLGREEEFLGYCRLHTVEKVGLKFTDEEVEE